MSYPGNPTPPDNYGQQPVPPGQPLYQTHIYPGQSPAARSLDGAVMGWAISSLILGGICALVYAVLSAALAVLPSSTSVGGLPRVVALIGFVSAAGVVAGSIAVLARQDWGRKLLITAITGAIITLCLDLVILATTGAPHASMIGVGMQQQSFPGHFGPPGAPAFPGQFGPMGAPQPGAFPGGAQAQNAFQQGFQFGAAAGDLGKLIYCALLLVFMLSARAKNALRRTV